MAGGPPTTTAGVTQVQVVIVRRAIFAEQQVFLVQLSLTHGSDLLDVGVGCLAYAHLLLLNEMDFIPARADGCGVRARPRSMHGPGRR